MKIKGLDKAVILMILYNNSKPLGLGIFNYDANPMDYDEAKKILKHQTYFDYYKGRVMKIDLSGDELDTCLYNRDNGEKAAENFINKYIIEE